MTMKILTTAGIANKHVIKTIFDLQAQLSTRIKEKRQVEVSDAEVKAMIEELENEWPEFKAAVDDGVNPFKVVDVVSEEVVLNAGKARVNKTIDLPGFIEDWMVHSKAATRPQARACMERLEQAGLLPAIRLSGEDLNEAQKTILEGSYTTVEHTGARTYKP